MKPIKFASLAKKLTKTEMKNFFGGDANPRDGEGGCPGVLLCVGVEVGQACPDVGESKNCTCKNSNGEKVCMP
jgi:hypothetical protein